MQDRDVTRLVGANIRTARSDIGLSQEALADAAGINRAGLGKIERGEVETKLITALKIAAVLGRELGELVPDTQWHPGKTTTGHWE